MNFDPTLRQRIGVKQRYSVLFQEGIIILKIQRESLGCTISAGLKQKCILCAAHLRNTSQTLYLEPFTCIDLFRYLLYFMFMT